MTPRTWLSVLAVLVAVGGGCGGQSSGGLPDAGPPPTFDAPPCDIQFGRTFVFDSLVILPAGEGVDITGDGQVDNALARLGPLANGTIADDIANGNGNFLLDFTRWDPTIDDNDFTMTFYLGVDADTPPDPSNNLGGDGHFLVVDRQFDVNCKPLTSNDSGDISGGVGTAQPDLWRFLVQAVGLVEYRQIQFGFTISPDMSQLDGKLGAGWTICNLSRMTGPLFAGGSLLSLTVNQLNQPVPDLDIDGDGLEQLIGDGKNGVTACIDGDGTRIDGPDCPCDPRIADAYSIGVSVHAVRATIDGVLYSP